MKILHIIDSLNVGGAETLVTGLSIASKRSGFEAVIYALRSGGPLETVAAENGVTVYTASAGSVYSPLHIFRLSHFLKSHSFDLIHVHLYPAQLWATLAMSLCGCQTPIVTTEHSTSNQRRTVLFRWLDRWMYRRYCAIAAISEATRTALVAHTGHRIPDVRVVPNGIDTTRFFPPVRESRPAKTTGLVILSTGRLSHVKDQATIIRAVSMIADVRLMLAGDGPERENLRELAAGLGVLPRVDFLGVRTDIPDLVAASDLYVQASRWEGFGLAAVEAMCGGLPCIASRTSGLQEVVGPAGLYFTPGNSEELASAIRILCADPERRHELAEQGIIQARKFTLPACQINYENFYRDTIIRYSQETTNIPA